MTTAKIFNISRCCVDDGPGIRTTVFLKGCPLRCVWCHNPESQRTASEITFDARSCTGCGRCAAACEQGCHRIDEGLHQFDRANCIACGKCAEVCPVGSLELVGSPMSADEVFAKVVRDKIFYKNSGGGVTFSGGEPLMHPEFLTEMLTRLRAEGIHTAIETCGFCDSARFASIAKLCDLLLFDLKETDPERHKTFTGAPFAPILANLRIADELGVDIHIRMPIIPGLNDRDEHFAAAAKLAKELSHVVAVQIMPYHVLGAYKYETLGERYALPDVSEPDAATKKRWQDTIDRLMA